MRDGTKISVADMDINHLRNALKMVLRNIEQRKKVPVKPKFEIHGEIAQSMIDDAMEQEFFSALSNQEQDFYGI